MLESAIQRKILKKLKKRPDSFSYKHQPSPPGMPDICHIEAGKVYFFEVKRDEKEEARPLQKLRHEQLLEAGSIVHVVWSWEQVKEVLDDI